MADIRSPDIEGLNEFGLPRHGDGVGPTLRPDIIAERHLHDWDRPEAAATAFADLPEPRADRPDLATQMIADDRLQRARMSTLPPTAADFGETEFAAAPGGDNEQQCARRAHAMAQDGGESAP